MLSLNFAVLSNWDNIILVAWSINYPTTAAEKTAAAAQKTQYLMWYYFQLLSIKFILVYKWFHHYP